MNYTLHQLHVFVKIVQTGSVTKAAEEMFMTQPAVSIQLKNFQDQFDIPLMENVGRHLRITDFGKEIFSLAKRILNEVYAINYKSQAYKGLLSGRLKVGVVSTGKYVMPYLLTDFMKLNHGIELAMDVTNKSKVVERLADGELDFALVSVLPEKLNIDEEIIMPNELYAVANFSFTIPSKKLAKGELENLPLIYREEGSATRMVMENFFYRKNIHVKKKIELTSNEAVKQAVLAGLGISIMPIIGLREDIKRRKLKIIPVAGLPLKTKWRLIWLSGKKMSPASNAYINYFRENKQNIIQKYFAM